MTETVSIPLLAYSTLSQGGNGGYKIFLNPLLDQKEVSRHPSQELEEVSPSEVPVFLFLHQIGHTPKAGNQCYFTVLVNHSISGGKRSARRRRELRILKGKIEEFADQFALEELKKWRVSDASLKSLRNSVQYLQL